jgi:GT2 family glycosyltransferase
MRPGGDSFLKTQVAIKLFDIYTIMSEGLDLPFKMPHNFAKKVSLPETVDLSMVYIILVNWNNGAATIRCLKSLEHLLKHRVQVLVCDNASTDTSALDISTYINDAGLSSVTILRNPLNGGFAYGNNVGLRMALSDPRMKFAWILNNDTQVSASSLHALLAHLQQNPYLGLCGSVLVRDNSPMTIQACGASYNRLLGTTRHLLEGAHTTLLTDARQPLPSADFLVGASLLATRRLIETIGLLDESYFLYYEDLDWCTRARKAGFSFDVVANSIVRHVEGASTGVSSRTRGSSLAKRMPLIYYRSCLLYSIKHDRRFHLVVRVSMLLRAIKALLQGQLGKAWAALYSMILVWS